MEFAFHAGPWITGSVRRCHRREHCHLERGRSARELSCYWVRPDCSARRVRSVRRGHSAHRVRSVIAQYSPSAQKGDWPFAKRSGVLCAIRQADSPAEILNGFVTRQRAANRAARWRHFFPQGGENIQSDIGTNSKM